MCLFLDGAICGLRLALLRRRRRGARLLLVLLLIRADTTTNAHPVLMLDGCSLCSLQIQTLLARIELKFSLGK